ncbi:30S ribosomal protein S16 [bacterium]|nr:30S ribosomal protein S16 [bacterium]
MLTIRLLRIGKKHQPSYKIVVTDKRRAPAGGRFVEEIGNYDPKTKTRNIKKDRAQYWISVGAQPSDTVHNMLVSEKVIDQPKRKIFFVKPEPKAEEPKVEAKVEEKKEEVVAEETVAEEVATEEAPAETPAEEVATETPAEETPAA